MSKKVLIVLKEENRHWVGDGFYVHGLLRPNNELHAIISPFILLDYASPMKFKPSNIPKGVGKHPHRGFETVTFAYQGEVEHKDSSGAIGTIKTGDIQWMTAGRGVIHEEFHSREFSKTGGVFEMVQLWVNLPKKYKMIKPSYQAIVKKDIPTVSIQNNTTLRVVAGKYNNIKGPANTYTEINIYDISSKEKENINLNFNIGTNTILLIMSGNLSIDNKNYEEKSILILEREKKILSFQTSNNFKALILNGKPIDEPIVAHGPFVMNSKQEILTAINDYQNGSMENNI
jgi:redox-sensitive bicupin YhaK (pirin superfamily)